MIYIIYTCRHTWFGGSKDYTYTMDIVSIEDCCDVPEHIMVALGGLCDGNCINPSCNHCECSNLFDDGVFEIINREVLCNITQ